MYAGLLQPNLQVLSPEIEQKETTTEQKDQNNALYRTDAGWSLRRDRSDLSLKPGRIISGKQNQEPMFYHA